MRATQRDANRRHCILQRVSVTLSNPIESIHIYVCLHAYVYQAKVEGLTCSPLPPLHAHSHIDTHTQTETCTQTQTESYARSGLDLLIAGCVTSVIVAWLEKGGVSVAHSLARPLATRSDIRRELTQFCVVRKARATHDPRPRLYVAFPACFLF